MNELLCKDCQQPLTLIEDSWVCHNCKRFVSKKTEVYSRVVGYLRPTSQWNKGKQQEYNDRKVFEIKE